MNFTYECLRMFVVLLHLPSFLLGCIWTVLRNGFCASRDATDLRLVRLVVKDKL